MGLDQYLYGRVDTFKAWNGDDSELRKAMVKAAVKAGLPPSDNIDAISISREVGYWRKANQIHCWFVANVQDGQDDCREYYVSREKLQELRDICQRIIDECPLADGKVNNGYTFSGGVETPIIEDGQVMTNATLAEQLLPTKEGFFFGSTDYDQYYMADLQDTVGIVDKCLALPEEVEFYYRASW